MTHDNRRQGECQRVDKYKLKRIKIHGLIVVEHDEGYDQRSIDVIPLEVQCRLLKAYNVQLPCKISCL